MYVYTQDDCRMTLCAYAYGINTGIRALRPSRRTLYTVPFFIFHNLEKLWQGAQHFWGTQYIGAPPWRRAYSSVRRYVF